MAGFNYQAIMTPGGVGPALSNLAGTLAQSAVERRRIEERAAAQAAARQESAFQFGLAKDRLGLEGERLNIDKERQIAQQKRADAEGVHWTEMANVAREGQKSLEEHRNRTFQADQDAQAAKGLADFRKTLFSTPDPKDAAQTELYKAQTDALRGKTAPDPNKPSEDLIRRANEFGKAEAAAKGDVGTSARLAAMDEGQAGIMGREGFVKIGGEWMKNPPPPTPMSLGQVVGPSAPQSQNPLDAAMAPPQGGMAPMLNQAPPMPVAPPGGPVGRQMGGLGGMTLPQAAPPVDNSSMGGLMSMFGMAPRGQLPSGMADAARLGGVQLDPLDEQMLNDPRYVQHHGDKLLDPGFRAKLKAQIAQAQTQVP